MQTIGGKTNYSIYNGNTGNIILEDATISSTQGTNSYGICNSSTGTITIGTRDGLVDTSKPDVYGEMYGVYNKGSGNIYFYDGILKGDTLAVYGSIANIESNTSYSDDIGTATEIYLVQESGNEAKIGETEYATLEEAIDNYQTGETIQLLRSISLFENDEPIVIAQEKEMIIDLAGNHIVSAIQDVTIQNYGTLTLCNTTAESESAIQARSTNWIINEETGLLNLIGIPTINTGNGTIIQNKGTANLTNSLIASTDITPIYNTGMLELTETYVVSENNNWSVQNVAGTMQIHSGNVVGIQNQEGTLIQENGTIEENRTILGSSAVGYAIENTKGIVQIKAGTVDGAIYSDGIVTIGVKDNNIDTASPMITGTSQKEEVIYGILNRDGELYMYDGTIKGKYGATNAKISDIEDNAEVVVNTETIDNEQYEVLTLQTIDAPAVSINGTTYETLQDAIDACADNTPTTITVLRNTVVSNAEIPNTKNIVLDINGKVVTQYQTLVNYGILRIVDNSGLDTGNITSYQSSAIQNAGTLEVAGGKIGNNAIGIQNTGTCNIVSGTIDGNSIGISNERTGTLTVAGGTFSNNTQGIAQKGSGTTTVTSGTFDTNESGTYATAGTIVVENATFTGNPYANHVAGGRMTIVDGTFTNNQYGMYIQSGQGFSGIKDTVVGVAPNIVGTVSGIIVDAGGVLHFYDGTIQGTESAISGYATYVEDGYKVQSSTVDGLYTDTLALAGTVQTVARVDDVEFSSVQSAINSCIGDTAKTVTLLNTVTVTETLHIDSDLKVILDLNKHNIEGNFAGSIIDNSGELTIIDSSTEKTGKIINSGGQGIYNTGTLTIGTDDGTIEETVRVEGSTTGLQTTGTFNYYDGLLAGNTVIDGTVNSLPSGSVIRTRTENGLTVYYID